MTDKEIKKLADLIAERLLTGYIEQQSQWYTNDTFTGMFDMADPKKKKKRKRVDKPITEDELLGELAKLLTQIEYHKMDENYEKCAKLQVEVDKINKKLDEL